MRGSSTLKRLLALVLAVALVISSGLFANVKTLKAAENPSETLDESSDVNEETKTDLLTDDSQSADDESKLLADDESLSEDDAEESEEEVESTSDADTGEAEASEEVTEENTSEESDAEVSAEASEEVAEEAAMPANSFTETTANGVRVAVSYGEDTFPEGTTLSVKDVNEDKALEAAEQVVEDAAEAVAVDITFTDVEGNELQPANNKKVDVAMYLEEALSGDEFTVVHIDDEGNAEKVNADEYANSAEFKADSFSIYALTSAGKKVTNEKAYAMVLGEELEIVDDTKEGGPAGKYYKGEWKITKGNDAIEFTETNDSVLKPEASDEPHSVKIKAKAAGTATVVFEYTNKKKQDVFNITITTYTVHFDLNGGSGAVPKDEVVSMGQENSAYVQLPAASGFSREGYEFIGWSLHKTNMEEQYGWYSYTSKDAAIYNANDGNDDSTNDMFLVTKGTQTEYTFYAMWANKSNLTGKIGFFVRKDGVIQQEPATHSSSLYYTVTPGTTKKTSDVKYLENVNLCDYITIVKTETDPNKVMINVTATAQQQVENTNKTIHEKTGQWVWNPDTEYIQWYVIKDQTEWHVDGVIRKLDNVSLDYNRNCEGDYTGQAPAGKTYTKGTKVKVEGAGTLKRNGFVFVGWNTKPDGTGIGYVKDNEIVLNENTTLYAQWVPPVPYLVEKYDVETKKLITTDYHHGMVGDKVSATDADKTLSGYTFVDGYKDNVLSTTIKKEGGPDGKDYAKIKLYFKKTHAVVFTANVVNKVYDGEEVIPSYTVTVDGDKAEYTVANDGKLKVTVAGEEYTIEGIDLKVKKNATDANPTTAKDVGNYVSTFVDKKNVKIYKGSDVEKAITVDCNDGTIVISKRQIVITSGTDSKEYDGDPLTKKTVTIAGKEGSAYVDQPLATGDTVESIQDLINFTGSQTAPGTSDNTFAPKNEKSWEQILPNYSVATVNGKLTVTSRTAKYQITVAANNVNKDYNGDTQSVRKGEFTVKGTEKSAEEKSVFERIGDFVTGTNTVYFKMDGKEFKLTGLYTEGSGKDVAKDGYPITVQGDNLVIKDNSNNVVTDQFIVNKQNGKLTINPINITLTSATLSKVYDDEPLTNGNNPLTVTGSFVGSEGLDMTKVTFSESVKFPGETKANKFNYEDAFKSNTTASNYNIQKVEGTLSITSKDAKYQVTLTPNGGSYKYDGTSHSVSGFVGQNANGAVPVQVEVKTGVTKTYYVSGLTAGATLTDAGETAVAVDGTAVVKNVNGDNVSQYFNVNYAAAKLTVTKRTVEITPASLSKEYDGDPLSNPAGQLKVKSTNVITVDTEASVSGDGWAKVKVDGKEVSEESGVTYNFTGSQTLAGYTSNKVTVSFDGVTAKAGNYNVTYKEGTLTVNNRNENAKYTATITGKSKTVVYDGTVQTVSGFVGEKDNKVEVTAENGKKYYVDVTGLTSTRSGTKVADSGDTSVNGSAPKVYDTNGKEVTKSFKVTVNSGKLTINKRPITLSSGDLEKAYDGNALLGGGDITVGGDGISSVEKLVPSFTGSQTLVGTSPNSFTYKIVKKTVTTSNNADEGNDLLGGLLGTVVAHADETNEAVTEEDLSANYDIQATAGTLKVTPVSDGNKPDGIVGKSHGDATKVYEIGETVEFTLTAKNIFAEARNITFVEQEGVEVEQDVWENVAPGATVTTTATYTITEADAVAGTYKNVVTVSYTNPDDPTDKVEYTEDDDVIPETPNAAISVTKEVVSEGSISIGETVVYSITVVNNGNVTVKDITVADELTGDEWTIDSLKAGASKEFEAEYTVTEDDVANGNITNIATAKGEDPSGNPVENQGETTDDVDQMFRLTIHYVDSEGNTVANDYANDFKYGDSFYVASPEVEGFTPDLTFIASDEKGMPAQNLEVTVVYSANPVEEPEQPGTGDEPSNPQTPGNPTGGNTPTQNQGTTPTGGVTIPPTVVVPGTAPAVPVAGPAPVAIPVAFPVGAVAVAPVAATPVVNNIAADGTTGAVVSVDEAGTPNLVKAEDTQTPLANLELDDHLCNVLHFILLLLTLAVVILHTNRMKKHQKRVFELREKLTRR